MRLAGRVILAGVAAALVLAAGSAALFAWFFYENSQPLNMTAISELLPVRSADRAVAARIDADASALARGAPWMSKQGGAVADSCQAGFADEFDSRNVPWQCTRQVLEVYGVAGSIRARHAALVSDLTGDGWATGSLQPLDPGFDEQLADQETGQFQKGNLGVAGVPMGGYLTVFWARRPALLTVPVFKPLISEGFVDPVIRRAYARYAEVVILCYSDQYAEGTGGQVSSAATPPSTQGAGPCPSGLTNC